MTGALGDPAAGARRAALLDSARHILPLAWPVFVAQLAVVAFGTVDTVLVARYAAVDLAALAVGMAAYITVFVGFMGAVLAVGPIAGQLFGARRLHDAGAQLHQAVWIAIGLSVIGSTLLVFPYPFLALSEASPQVEAKVRDYLMALAFSLPASLLFAAYRGFNNAVSRPKAVMVIQVAGLVLKVPLSIALIYGVPALRIPELGVFGCGIATGIAMWAQVLVALWWLHRDAFYRPFDLGRGGLRAPDPAALRAQLKLGIPMGLSILLEVTAFALMAIFIARLGATAVAGHQLAVNLVSLLYMLPLAMANAAGVLVAQRIGAGDARGARRLGWHGMQIGVAISALLGAAVYLLRESVLRLYTPDATVVAAALPLLAWVALFHTTDAAQTIAGFVLRSYRIATLPMVIVAVCMWGVGLGGGYALAFNVTGLTPPAFVGARGFWVGATSGLVLAALALGGLLAVVLNRSAPDASSPRPA